jgi:shikimate kinase
MIQRHLLLTGLSGAGKSSVGRRVAQLLCVEFVDLDRKIEKRAGMNVGLIFDRLGEPEFRRMESELLAEVLKSVERRVIALGGGTLADSQNHSLAVSNGTVVWLQVSPNAAAQRCRSSSEHRPLLNNGRAEDRLREQLANRKATYTRCSFSIQTDGRTVEDIAASVFHLLNKENTE